MLVVSLWCTLVTVPIEHSHAGVAVTDPMEQITVQFKMVSMCSEKPVIMRSASSVDVLKRYLSNRSTVCLSDDGPFSSFQGGASSTSSFHASLLQAIDGVMPLALCPRVVSQALQHFRSSEQQATCDGRFARQSVCSVISFHSGMFSAVHLLAFRRWMSKVDTWLSGLVIALFTVCVCVCARGEGGGGGWAGRERERERERYFLF